MLCLKKRRTYSFTQGACNDLPRRSTNAKNDYNEALNIAVTTLPRKHRSREERASGGMVLTVTEDTPADMLAGSMELLVQLPRDHHVHTQRVTVPRSTPMMDLLVQIATAHKLAASSYTLQAIGERGLVLPHQPNTPIGALDALQVKLLPKQGTFLPRKAKQANQPFETTFRLQVLLPRNQLYVSRVSPKMNLGKILEEVCREKNLDKNKYELRHPANLEETLDLSLSLQDYHLQEVTLYAKQGRTMGAALSSQDIMALQRQEERRRQQAKQSVFGFMFRKSKESSLSIDSLSGRSVSPARSDETGRSVSPLAPPARPQRKRRPAPKPPVQTSVSVGDDNADESKEKLVISHSRNSSDSSGYHEASVLSDNPDSSARMPETLPRRSKPPCKLETPRKLAQTSQASKSLGNLAMASGGLSHGISSTSISSTGIRKKRAAPPPPVARPLSSAISTQALERIVDSEESLTSDIDISKSPSDIAGSSKANSDIGVNSKANSDIGVQSLGSKGTSEIGYKIDSEFRAALADHDDNSTDSERRVAPPPPIPRTILSLNIQDNIPKPVPSVVSPIQESNKVETARVVKRAVGDLVPIPKPRSIGITIPAASRCRAVETGSKNHSTDMCLPKPTTAEHDPSVYLHDNNYGNSNEIEEKEKTMKNDSEHVDVELRTKNEANFNNPDKIKIDAKAQKTSTMMHSDKLSQYCGLKHVKSMDDIYGVAMEFTDDELPELSNSKSGTVSCAVISTIPKCVHLAPKIDNIDDIHRDKVADFEKNVKSSLKKTDPVSKESDNTGLMNQKLNVPAKRTKIFRSQSALNDFDVNPFEKHTRHFTSHPEDFTCALNPNFSRTVLNLEAKESANAKTQKTFIKHNVEKFPPFVMHGTNLGSEDKSAIDVIEGNHVSRMIKKSASGDRPTETDILLQKVSDTLSNSLPFDESLAIVVPDSSRESEKPVVRPQNTVESQLNLAQHENDVPDGALKKSENSKQANDTKCNKDTTKITKQAGTQNRESLLSEKNVVNTSTPNATINSQQDTSDYVSATGDDISITDWEYQLPAPPSAFRDNVSPDFDGYDTITLRSVEAFKEPIENASDPRESAQVPIVEPQLCESLIPVARNDIVEVEKPAVISKAEIRPKQTEKPKISPPALSENRNSDLNAELKNEIITELATKIESGCLSQQNSRIADQDSRRITEDCAAPKIAPVDNTLSNFTITTYSRQKSLNIFEEEPLEERRNVSHLNNSEDKVLRSFAALSRNKPISQNTRGNIDHQNTMDRTNDEFPLQGKPVMSRAQSVEHIITSDTEFKKPTPKSQFTQHDSLLRRQSLSNGHEKSTIVHRSKSYIMLANNSKYREDVSGQKLDSNSRNDLSTEAIIKSTSVTNLNQEAPKHNEKFSQWRENMLKRQEEPSKEKQLQSLQVLKSILPRLKNTQQPDENVVDSSKETKNSHENPSKTPAEVSLIESKSNATDTKRESDAKPQKIVEDATTKRYKYAGPPAISLGSWSERPRVNVQLKMDTDYKFGTNNTSGAKTVVNLNGTNSARINETQSKENSIKTVPKNVAKNGTVTSNGIPTNQETLRRDSDDERAKKLITHTPTAMFKKPTLNRVGLPETKNGSINEDKPVVTSVALKKTYIEKPESRVNGQQQRDDEDDDVKIDTKPVNFKELTKTFGQEVCLRAKPKRVIQNRHSDYYGARSDVVQNFANSRPFDSAKSQTVSNGVARDTNHAPLKRYTSIVGIQSQNNSNYFGSENVESATKNHTTTMKMNLMPVVKGFKIQTGQTEAKASTTPIVQNGVTIANAAMKNENSPPPPPTMPIITGVTLKNSTSRPKSMPVGNADPRDQLLESIRSFGGRDKLKSVIS